MSITNIPALWIPITSKTNNVNEKFVSTTDTTSIIENIFIILGAILISGLITTIFYWSYNSNKKLFISLLSGVVFLYSLMNIIGTVVIKNSINNTYFKVFLGAGIIMGSVSIVLIILFAVIASRDMTPRTQ